VGGASQGQARGRSKEWCVLGDFKVIEVVLCLSLIMITMFKHFTFMRFGILFVMFCFNEILLYIIVYG